ncbi:sigma-70 family RNA polymerase sigma factor [Alkalihalobacillus sp. AL-G]|uniref:sigma-70 family RNA polymerase sigma factor n=1 Tax=Alkalihalobacillus sp. AL-G TaxID=2926399 RepID=UPI00272C3F6C|nr:sigma-70 family RNA polymerase sigma factor [Alkalihalobacillus sp. AL-G]WLD91723.1 sigma-70 family RNA polymerase sigma factor [Alkalihalobacillus sp. AL-G]
MSLYTQDVYLLAYSFVIDQGLAEGISQEVFIKCYKHVENFRGDASIKSWVYRITVNTSKDFVRKKVLRLKYPKLLLGNLQKTESPEESFFKDNQRDQLLHKVLSLLYKYREVIELYYVNDLTINEVGVTLNLNTNTIKTRLVRGRAKLKENLVFQKGEIF